MSGDRYIGGFFNRGRLVAGATIGLALLAVSCDKPSAGPGQLTEAVLTSIPSREATRDEPRYFLERAIALAERLLAKPDLNGFTISFLDQMRAMEYMVGEIKPVYQEAEVGKWGLLKRPYPSSSEKYGEYGRINAGGPVRWIGETEVEDKKSGAVELFGLLYPDGEYQMAFVRLGEKPAGAKEWVWYVDPAPKSHTAKAQ